MAKRRKAPSARKPHVAQAEEHSLLLRSAESLGRVIGALQRQLDEPTRRMGAAKVAKKVRKKKPATKRKRTAH